MEASFFRTLNLAAAPTSNPTSVIRAPGVPLRVVARNINAAGTIILSFTTTDLATPGAGATNVTSEVFNLPAGSEDIFILAPGQTMYAVSTGGVPPLLLSIFANEAFPVL